MGRSRGCNALGERIRTFPAPEKDYNLSFLEEKKAIVSRARTVSVCLVLEKGGAACPSCQKRKRKPGGWKHPIDTQKKKKKRRTEGRQQGFLKNKCRYYILIAEEVAANENLPRKVLSWGGGGTGRQHSKKKRRYNLMPAAQGPPPASEHKESCDEGRSSAVWATRKHP